MTDYSELVKDLRDTERVCRDRMDGQVMLDAADAIEELTGFLAEAERDRDEYEERMRKEQERVIKLQAEVERLKDSNEELREKQTYIDHYGAEWMTSAKDVPTAAYEHGYADGRDEAEAQLPKRGHWEPVPDAEGRPYKYVCSNCHRFHVNEDEWYGYCPNCGAVMGVPIMDGPIITPCRGCSDYDGYGGCKSKGGCARAKMEVQE